MNKPIFSRIILDILILLAMMHGWSVVALPLALIGVWRFPYFVEIIIAGIIYDSLFGFVPEMGVIGYLGTIVSVGLFLLLILAKKVMRK